MKRNIIGITLAAVMLLSLCACGNKDADTSPSPTATETPTAVITERPSDDMLPDVDDGVVEDENNSTTGNDNLGEEIIDDAKNAVDDVEDSVENAVDGKDETRETANP